MPERLDTCATEVDPVGLPPLAEPFADVLSRALAQLPAPRGIEAVMPGPLPRRSMMSRILARKAAARLSLLPMPCAGSAPVIAVATEVAEAPPPALPESILIAFPVRPPSEAGETDETSVAATVECDTDEADFLVLDDAMLADAPVAATVECDSDEADVLVLDDAMLAETSPRTLSPAESEGPEAFTLHDDFLPPHAVTIEVAEDAPPALPMTDSQPAGMEEDLLLLDDSYLAPAEFPVAIPLPEPSPSPAEPEMRHLLEDVLAVLTVSAVLEEPASPPDAGVVAVADAPEVSAEADAVLEAREPEPAGEEDVLVLDESFLAPEPPPSPPALLIEPHSREEMTALIAAATPEEAGDLDLPDRLDSLSALLLNPTSDFQALDLLKTCWPSQSSGIRNRALLAVAINLSRNFGSPGRLPMAAARAWRQLDPELFQTALVQRLAAIGDFITDWQRSQAFFLSLDYSEIELIEYLFETIHPGHNIELLASVMEFKVLSGRRLGLLRRIPFLCRRLAEGVAMADREAILKELAHRKALLERIIHPTAFRPVAEAAQKSLDEVVKLMKQVANPPAPPPAPGSAAPLPLGRI